MRWKWFQISWNNISRLSSPWPMATSHIALSMPLGVAGFGSENGTNCNVHIPGGNQYFFFIKLVWQQMTFWAGICKTHISPIGTQVFLVVLYNRDQWSIRVRSRMCGCLFTWFCYHLITKPGNKTAAPSWPDPYHFLFINQLKTHLVSMCFSGMQI